MALKVGINGYGRIGRNVLRALYEGGKRSQLQVVALNDLGDAKINARLTRYDTVHGRFTGDVKIDGDALLVNGDRIKVLSERDPAKLPWGSLGVDTVLECTGLFTSKAKAAKHLQAGANKVVISSPGGDDVDATIVYGVNHGVLKASHTVISNASCTTNCLAPLAKVLNDSVGIAAGVMTTIHSYTNDQVLVDVYHTDLRRARSATHSMIPTKTGAAAAVGLVMPELKGKLDGFAIRVPTINVSLVDLSFTAKRATSIDEINGLMKTAAASGPLQGSLAYTDAPLVSVDYNHDSHSSVYDATMTKVIAETRESRVGFATSPRPPAASTAGPRISMSRGVVPGPPNRGPEWTPKMPTKRRAPRHRSSGPAVRRSQSPLASTPASPAPLHIESPPTGHEVCRSCGRIVRLELSEGDSANLVAFADRRPDGWSADGVSLTVTGVCPRCREGLAARP